MVPVLAANRPILDAMDFMPSTMSTDHLTLHKVKMEVANSLLFFLVHIGSIYAQQYGYDHSYESLDLKMIGYDKRLTPASASPSNVSVHFLISSIRLLAIDMQADVTMVMRWKDHRLAFGGPLNQIRIDETLLDHIWIPRVYFPNLEFLAYDAKSETAAQLSTDGHVLYRKRLVGQFRCPELYRYRKKQNFTCSLILKSWNPIGAVTLEWSTKFGPVALGNGNQVLIGKRLDIKQLSTDNSIVQDPLGHYSCLTVHVGIGKPDKIHRRYRSK